MTVLNTRQWFKVVELSHLPASLSGLNLHVFPIECHVSDQSDVLEIYITFSTVVALPLKKHTSVRYLLCKS